jgi:DNA modification methylase
MNSHVLVAVLKNNKIIPVAEESGKAIDSSINFGEGLKEPHVASDKDKEIEKLAKTQRMKEVLTTNFNNDFADELVNDRPPTPTIDTSKAVNVESKAVEQTVQETAAKSKDKTKTTRNESVKSTEEQKQEKKDEEAIVTNKRKYAGQDSGNKKTKKSKKAKPRNTVSPDEIQWDDLDELQQAEHTNRLSKDYQYLAMDNKVFFTNYGEEYKDKVDLVLTDPPYGVFTKFVRDKMLSIPDMNLLLENCYHVLKPHGTIVIFSKWQQIGDWNSIFKSKIDKFTIYRSALFCVREPNAGFIQKGGSNMQNMVEMAVVAYKKGNGRHTFNWLSKQAYLEGDFMRGTNVIQNVSIVRDKLCDDNGCEFRVEEKNIDMLKEIIARFSNRGDLVCDPFGGTGTTMLASYELERDFIGCEIDKDLVKAANKRFYCDSYTYDLSGISINLYFRESMGTYNVKNSKKKHFHKQIIQWILNNLSRIHSMYQIFWKLHANYQISKLKKVLFMDWDYLQQKILI